MARARKSTRITINANSIGPRRVSARGISTPAKKVVPAASPVKKAKGKSRGRPAKSATGTEVKKAAATGVKKKKTSKVFGKRTKKRASTAATPTCPGPEVVYNDELANDGDEYEVEAILDSRKEGENTFYQVKWKGWSQMTWEPEVHLRNSTDLITDFDEKFPEKA